MNCELESHVFLLYALALQGNFSNTRVNRLIKDYFNRGDLGNLIKPLVKRLPPEFFNRAKQEILEAKELGVNLVSLLDEHYPELLRHIDDPPLVLFYRGELPLGPPVAIVGTRKATQYGRRFALSLAQAVSGAGGVVISGLAHGIDRSAHEGAVLAAQNSEEGSGGIAVLGSGLLSIYPAANRPLAEELLDSGGAIVSEYGLRQRPRKDLFPRRNRIVSGLAQATVVVEAAERSGSLITARTALEQGREVFALPGPIDSELSAGTNRLISEGAIIIRNTETVLEHFPELVTEHRKAAKQKGFENLGKAQQKILSRLLERTAQDQSPDLDDLLAHTDLSPQELMGYMAELELQGLVELGPEGYWVKQLIDS